jgi:hypothetical protein
MISQGKQMQPDQSQPRKEELNPKNTGGTSAKILMQKESPTPSSGVNTPQDLGFPSQEQIAAAIQWGSNLTPTDLEYLDDQGL